MSYALRPYQLEGIERVRESIRAGARRVLLVLATGGGKTVVAAHVVSSAVALGSRVLFVAHRRELIKQSFCKLVRNGLPPEEVGVIMASVGAGSADLFASDPVALRDEELWSRCARRRPTARVQVASIDTLRNRNKPAADLVIVDEAHRGLARSYTDLQVEYPNAIHLGLTATPYRADGKGLGNAYDELVTVASPSILIADGFLVAPRVFTVPASALPDLRGVKVRGGDYSEEDLERAVDTGALVGDIVEHWQRRAAGVRTVAFACSVAHSKHIAERFRAAGVAAEHLDGTTETAERDAILGRLERGETLVVSNCGVLCEGWDQPSVKCCILARPTKSTGLYLQQAGRILRPYKGQDAIILDHAGCAVEHQLPQADREFSLDDAPKKGRGEKEAAPPTKTCEQCFAVVPTATRVCPECGFVWPEPEAKPAPEEQAGELVEVRAATPEEMRAAWEQLCAERGGRKPGWVWHRFMERFGVKPPRDWKVPEGDEDKPTTEALHDYLVTCLRDARAKGHKDASARFRFKYRHGFFPSQLAWERAVDALVDAATLPPEPESGREIRCPRCPSSGKVTYGPDGYVSVTWSRQGKRWRDTCLRPHEVREHDFGCGFCTPSPRTSDDFAGLLEEPATTTPPKAAEMEVWTL